MGWSCNFCFLLLLIEEVSFSGFFFFFFQAQNEAKCDFYLGNRVKLFKVKVCFRYTAEAI